MEKFANIFFLLRPYLMFMHNVQASSLLKKSEVLNPVFCHFALCVSQLCSGLVSHSLNGRPFLGSDFSAFVKSLQI